MKRSPRILVANLALIVLIAFLCFVLHPSEPTYQGRRLREWLINAAMTVVYPNANADAVKAIRHIGSNAVPTLLSYAAAKDSPVKKSIMKWNDRLPAFLSLPVSPQIEQEMLAQVGFNMLGPGGKSAVPGLVRLLQDDDESVRVTAAVCLGFIGPGAELAVPELIKEFEREKSATTNGHFEAAFALGQIGPAAQAAIPSLKAGLTNNSTDCQRISQAALINIHALSISPLLEQLKDTTNNQWVTASMVVLQCGTNALPAVPLFISALDCTNHSIQSRSLSALGWLHQEPKACVPAVMPFLTAKDDYLRQNAINVLRCFGKESKPAVPALLRCLSDPNYSVREVATNALREIDPEAAAKAGIK